jgi:hypothetical protein
MKKRKYKTAQKRIRVNIGMGNVDPCDIIQ